MKSKVIAILETRTGAHLGELIARRGGIPMLAPALEEAVAEPGPYLLNVKVTPFECVYPMVPAGAAIQEMVLGPPQPVTVPTQ